VLPPEDEDGYPADITGVTRHTDQEDDTSREDMKNEENYSGQYKMKEHQCMNC